MNEQQAFRDLIDHAKANTDVFPVDVPKNIYGFAPDERRVGKQYTTEMFDCGWNRTIRADGLVVSLREYNSSISYLVGDEAKLLELHNRIKGGNETNFESGNQ